MKKKLRLLMALLVGLTLSAVAQKSKKFSFPGGSFKLTTVCEWLNKEQLLNIGFNNQVKGLQQVVVIRKDSYTFESLFNEYFRPHNLEFSEVGNQIIIHAATHKQPRGPDGKGKDNRITISGYIMDSSSKERLQGATVVIVNKGFGAVSNAYGFYSLTIPEGENNVVVSVMGYEPMIQPMHLQNDTAITFQLVPAATTLSAVTITAPGSKDKKLPIQNSTQVSTIDLPIETIEAMPKLLGETDVFRSLQFLPGVHTGAEVSSNLYIRGGSPDQNLILLDGVPVYNASHLFGLFSAFNSDALQSVQLYKGGFPARFGGRLSSVIDLRMKEGNKNAWHGEGGIGLIASRFTLEGPLKKGRSSIMMSGRITNWGPAMKGISKLGSSDDYKSDVLYEFFDLNLKSNFYLGPKDHLYISGYFGKDRFHNDQEYSPNYGGSDYTNFYNMGFAWGNATAVARWNHQFSKKVFSNTTLHFGRYQYYLRSDDKVNNEGTSESIRRYQKNSSDLQDIAVKYDVDIVPNPDHYIRTGVSATRHYFVPGVFHSITESNTENSDTTISGGHVVSGEYDLYFEDDWQITNKWKANIGVHGTGFKVGQTFYTSLQPRMNIRYLLNQSMSIKGSFVYMNQFIHLLNNSGIGLPTDLWVPVTEKIPAQKSIQYTLGLAYTTPKEIELSAEAYYKGMKHVLEYEEGAAYTNTTINWEQRVAIGDGRSMGIELLAQKKKGKTTGLVSYTLSKTDRVFATINEGRRFPYRYDRRHDFKMAISHKCSEKLELDVSWILGSGQAISLPLETYMDPNGETIIVYSERNGYRMPVFHRADVSINFHKKKRRYLRTWVIGIYNIYSRQNALYIDFDPRNINNSGLKQASIMPFPIPSVTYQIKF